MMIQSGDGFGFTVFQMMVVAVGSIWFKPQHQRLFKLDTFKRHVENSLERDRYFHLSHRYYLSTHFSYRERVDCAISHYGYEETQYEMAYRDAVYEGEGLVFWSQHVNGTSIRSAFARQRMC